jgi:DNA-binding NarL/FixJ family response regulator
MRELTVVVADDDERIRHDFAQLLELEPDITVVGVAADGRAAVELCRALTPQVCVMDVRMPRLNGIDATASIRQHPGAPRLLVVTTFDLDEYVLSAVRAGASGFLLKDTAPEQLADAVRTVARGDGIVSPRATGRLLQELTRSRSRHSAATPLTERESELVRLMARGLRNEEIAVVAGISRATVKTHVSSILAKLGLTSRLQIVVWAYENGIA